MSYLLDTHVFIWLLGDAKRIPANVLEVCSDPDIPLYISVTSAWEMQIKYQLGKLALPTSPKRLIEEQCKTNGLKVLSIGLNHIARLNDLPAHHSDPFDRLLMAQAIEEGFTFITADEKIHGYEAQVEVMWA